MKYSAALLFLALCSFASAQTKEPQPPLRTLTLTVWSTKINAEVAVTTEEITRGLMFREKLGPNQGMLFVLGEPHQASFWMPHVKIPLSVAYLDRDGKILEIHDMKPFDETQTVSKSRQVAFALEMNQGWYKQNQIAAGDVLTPLGTTWKQLTAQSPLLSSP